MEKHLGKEIANAAQREAYLKTRGYILDEDSATAFWNDSTQRSPRLESRSEYPYKFKQLTV